jgi:hypothetical protein
MYQHIQLLGLPKFTQSGIFGMKTNHLATLPQRQIQIFLAEAQNIGRRLDLA